MYLMSNVPVIIFHAGNREAHSLQRLMDSKGAVFRRNIRMLNLFIYLFILKKREICISSSTIIQKKMVGYLKSATRMTCVRCQPGDGRPAMWSNILVRFSLFLIPIWNLFFSFVIIETKRRKGIRKWALFVTRTR